MGTKYCLVLDLIWIDICKYQMNNHTYIFFFYPVVILSFLLDFLFTYKIHVGCYKLYQ